MRTSRWRLATMVSVALVGGYSGSVLAQDIDLQSAEWLTPVEAYVFSLDRCEMGMPERYTEDGAGKVVGKIPHTCEVTHSDPRLSGTLTTVLTEHCFTVGGCVNWGTMDLVGPEGTWSGWFNGTEYNWTGASKTDLDIVLTGSEAYEGLVTVQHATGPFWGPMILDGVIYAGDPPPARVMLMPPE